MGGWISLHVTFRLQRPPPPTWPAPVPVAVPLASLALYDLFFLFLTLPGADDTYLAWPQQPQQSSPARAPSLPDPDSATPVTFQRAIRSLDRLSHRALNSTIVDHGTALHPFALQSRQHSAVSRLGPETGRWPREQGSQLPPRPALHPLRPRPHRCPPLHKARAQAQAQARARVPLPTSLRSLRASSRVSSASTVR